MRGEIFFVEGVIIHLDLGEGSKIVGHQHDGDVDVLQLSHRVIDAPHEDGEQRLGSAIQFPLGMLHLKRGGHGRTRGRNRHPEDSSHIQMENRTLAQGELTGTDLEPFGFGLGASPVTRPRDPVAGHHANDPTLPSLGWAWMGGPLGSSSRGSLPPPPSSASVDPVVECTVGGHKGWVGHTRT